MGIPHNSKKTKKLEKMIYISLQQFVQTFFARFIALFELDSSIFCVHNSYILNGSSSKLCMLVYNHIRIYILLVTIASFCGKSDL
jgi:hypothetical protein